MMRKVLGVVSIASLVLLLGLLFFTTPTQVGPLGVLLLFVLTYLVCLGIFTAAIWYLSKITASLFKKQVLAKPPRPLSDKKAYYLGTVLAFVPVLILAMQSFGGISLLELGLVALFAIIGSFLVIKQ
ncbi:hypothetical protein FWF48_01740 [Candidatus Saccharibacteria bacterium]|nr:hypothetical protein [Candidatus Saccharibacteria bacterium]